MRKEDKATVIEQITATLKEYSHIYLTETTTLNAEKTSNLRRECFKNDIKLLVVKNSLLKKAMESLDADYTALFVLFVLILFDKFLSAGERNLIYIFFDLVLGHTDTVINYGDGSVFLVKFHLDFVFIVNVRLAERSQLFELHNCVLCVGY